MKFCTRVRLKPSNDRGILKKNNIAENSVALCHDTDNILIYKVLISSLGLVGMSKTQVYYITTYLF